MFEKLAKNNNLFYSKLTRAIAVYDHKVYDRSDLDILNGAQRNFIITKLKSLGFSQVSGNKLEFENTIMVFPKNAHIASSPLDLIKFTKRAEDDYLILTPTQLFLFLFERYFMEKDEELFTEIKELVQKLPVNLKKIKDICLHEKFYEFYLEKYNEVTQLQTQAIESKLKNKVHIGKML